MLARHASFSLLLKEGSRPSFTTGFYWSLHQDGTIGFEAKLTGIVSTHALFPGEHASGPEWGTLVAPGVNAHVHQHFFQARARGLGAVARREGAPWWRLAWTHHQHFLQEGAACGVGAVGRAEGGKGWGRRGRRDER